MTNSANIIPFSILKIDEQDTLENGCSVSAGCTKNMLKILRRCRRRRKPSDISSGPDRASIIVLKYLCVHFVGAGNRLTTNCTCMLQYKRISNQKGTATDMLKNTSSVVVLLGAIMILAICATVECGGGGKGDGPAKRGSRNSVGNELAAAAADTTHDESLAAQMQEEEDSKRVVRITPAATAMLPLRATCRQRRKPRQRKKPRHAKSYRKFDQATSGLRIPRMARSVSRAHTGLAVLEFCKCKNARSDLISC